MFIKHQKTVSVKRSYATYCPLFKSLVICVIAYLSVSHAFADLLLEVKVETSEQVKAPSAGPNASWLSSQQLKCTDKGMANFGGKWMGGVSYGPIQTEGKHITLEIDFTPYESFYTWLDGHIISLQDMHGNVICRLDMVRRGRLRLTCGKNAAVSPVINWEGEQSRTLRIVWEKENARLEMNGKTWVSVKTSGLKTKKYIVCVGKLANGEPGAVGWYGGWRVNTDQRNDRAKQIDLGKQDSRFNKLLLLDRQIILDQEDSIKIPVQFSLSRARRAAAHLALDSLWAKLYRNFKLDHFDHYLAEVAEMAQQITLSDSPNEVFPLPMPIKTGLWLRKEDQQLYFGFCGWGMGCYMRELAELGFNLVSTSIWPDRVFNKDGSLKENYIKARILPLLDAPVRPVNLPEVS